MAVWCTSWTCADRTLSDQTPALYLCEPTFCVGPILHCVTLQMSHLQFPRAYLGSFKSASCWRHKRMVRQPIPSFGPLFCAEVTFHEGKNNLWWFQSFFYEGITWMFGRKSAKFYWHLLLLIFLLSKDQWHYPFVWWLLLSQHLFDMVRMMIVTGLI